jgi:O-antigen/teichoic acid export membrane protein
LNYFQATERFGRYLFVDGFIKISRLLTVILLAFTNSLTALTAVATYCFLPFAAFVVSVFLVPKEVLRLSLSGRRDLFDILHYTKWIVMTSVIAALFDRMDVFMLGHFWGPGEVGLYSAAFSLATLPDLVGVCMAMVIHPRVVKLYRNKGFKRVQSLYFKFAVPIGLAIALLAVLLGDLALRIIYTKEFAGAVAPFRLLVVGSLFWLVVTPFPASLMLLIVPKRILATTVLQFILTAIGGFLIIPSMGVTGAAIVILSVRVVIGLLALFLAAKTQKEEHEITTVDSEGEAIASSQKQHT